jgi:hypothetical protein
MTKRSNSDLKPRNGHTLRAAIIARVSGGLGQNEASLEDQQDNVREFIQQLYDGPIQFDVLASTKGNGEQLDRRRK